MELIVRAESDGWMYQVSSTEGLLGLSMLSGPLMNIYRSSKPSPIHMILFYIQWLRLCTTSEWDGTVKSTSKRFDNVSHDGLPDDFKDVHAYTWYNPLKINPWLMFVAFISCNLRTQQCDAIFVKLYSTGARSSGSQWSTLKNIRPLTLLNSCCFHQPKPFKLLQSLLLLFLSATKWNNLS